ncbi:MAG: tetratricopeptide repeat protein [Acidobacteria bacterium]|nr:tetratricopeptide repeat protein [Acidobacteriota bacterium]
MIKKSCRLFICLALFVVSAMAQDSRDMKKEAEIWEKLKAISPKSVATFKQATQALDTENYPEAAKLYEEVFKKAPDFDPVMRRLGDTLLEVGRKQEGMALLEMAVQKNRSAENLISLAYALTLRDDAPPTRANLNRALPMAKEAFGKNIDNSDSFYALLYAQLALDAQLDKDFREAVWSLALYHPDLMQTHYFKAVQAAMDEHWMEAETEIKKAESLGFPHEAATAFLASGIGSRATVWRYAYYTLYLLAAWVSGLVLLFVLGKLMSRMTMHWIETSDPNAATSNSHATLRKWYRRLINIGGVYYYLSLPVILFLTLAISGSIIYAMLSANYVAIKLVVIVGFGALVTIYSMIRSLFIRHEAIDPGRSLSRDEAPQLWALTEAVARSINTRPIDEIRVTPGTDLAVYERGSLRERLQDRAHRILNSRSCDLE